MLALILFAVVEENVDESAAAAVKDMEVLTALDDAAVAAVAAALQAACIFFRLFRIDWNKRKAEWRSFIRKISRLVRMEPGVADLHFNAR